MPPLSSSLRMVEVQNPLEFLDQYSAYISQLGAHLRSSPSSESSLGRLTTTTLTGAFMKLSHVMGGLYM